MLRLLSTLVKYGMIIAVVYLFATRVLADLPIVKDARHLVEVAVERQNKPSTTARQ